MSIEYRRVNKTTLQAIANAIRTKEQSEDAIALSDFATRIEALPTGGSAEIEELDEMPEATDESPSLIKVNGMVYIKKGE